MALHDKKLINDPNDVVTEFIERLIQRYPELQYLDGFPEVKVVLRADVSSSTYDKVSVISVGERGHEPAHAGFVGEGMLTAAVCGDVVASPPVDSILDAVRAVTGTMGCLLIVKIPLLDAAGTLECISPGIAKRAVEGTQMNMASSIKSQCMNIFRMQQVLPIDKRIKNGKLVLVDIAESENIEKTGADGRVLDETNKLLSTLGNVVSAFTSSPQDAVNGKNGAILTYEQGLGILHCNDEKGLLTGVIEWLLARRESSSGATACSIQLPTIEINMQKIRDLFYLSKDNLQMKESRAQRILFSGVTEIPLLDIAGALESISPGIANRAVEGTQTNMASSSKSQCMNIFKLQTELPIDKRIKNGKLVLVDLADFVKVEKTRANGGFLEEAKMIIKSVSTLGNVVCALTSNAQTGFMRIDPIPFLPVFQPDYPRRTCVLPRGRLSFPMKKSFQGLHCVHWPIPGPVINPHGGPNGNTGGQPDKGPAPLVTLIVSVVVLILVKSFVS